MTTWISGTPQGSQSTAQWEKLLLERAETAYLVLAVVTAKANSKISGEETVSAKHTELYV